MADQFKTDVENLRRMEWLTVRERWASVHVDFDRGGVYREHRVVWHDPRGAWLNATGQSFEEAVDNAMRTEYNPKTCEHYLVAKS
jgi:hypothetical protein